MISKFLHKMLGERYSSKLEFITCFFCLMNVLLSVYTGNVPAFFGWLCATFSSALLWSIYYKEGK